ncbi:LCP family protein [Synechococcus lacustris]|uniref:LCP family protein n=2 Tax=Synechococcus TaxID=1129 RepID=UPI0020CF9DFD|nr:LCP family protein [Synechococcus lacustris]
MPKWGAAQPQKKSLGFFSLAIAMAGGLGFGAFLLEPSLNALRGLDPGAAIQQLLLQPPQDVLILGTDESGVLTDVMATLHPTREGVHLMQIPRDTFIDSAVHGEIKANALFALGGIQEAETEVSNLLGRPLQHHILINLKAIRKLGDAVGGVEINVPKAMYYNDSRQNLAIALEPGLQTLRGNDLEGFLRFRHDEQGDLGRMDRQRLVVSALLKKLASPQVITQLPQLISVLGGDLKTDLNPIELASLATAVAGKPLIPSRLPGTSGYRNNISYWFVGSPPPN